MAEKECSSLNTSAASNMDTIQQKAKVCITLFHIILKEQNFSF
jgi:hypothetical protein